MNKTITWKRFSDELPEIGRQILITVGENTNYHLHYAILQTKMLKKPNEKIEYEKVERYNPEFPVYEPVSQDVFDSLDGRVYDWDIIHKDGVWVYLEEAHPSYNPSADKASLEAYKELVERSKYR